jgi:hypothetical protein
MGNRGAAASVEEGPEPSPPPPLSPSKVDDHRSHEKSEEEVAVAPGAVGGAPSQQYDFASASLLAAAAPAAAPVAASMANLAPTVADTVDTAVDTVAGSDGEGALQIPPAPPVRGRSGGAPSSSSCSGRGGSESGSSSSSSSSSSTVTSNNSSKAGSGVPQRKPSFRSSSPMADRLALWKNKADAASMGFFFNDGGLSTLNDGGLSKCRP